MAVRPDGPSNLLQDGFAVPVQDRSGPCCPDQHPELVPAQPSSNIVLRRAEAPDPLGDLFQASIADLRSERVIDMLEAIQADRQQGGDPATSLVVGPVAQQPVQKRRSTQQTGQRVGRRQGFHAIRNGLLLGDVLLHAEATNREAVLPLGTAGHANPTLVPLGGRNLRLELKLAPIRGNGADLLYAFAHRRLRVEAQRLRRRDDRPPLDLMNVAHAVAPRLVIGVDLPIP